MRKEFSSTNDLSSKLFKCYRKSRWNNWLILISNAYQISEWRIFPDDWTSYELLNSTVSGTLLLQVEYSTVWVIKNIIYY